MPVQKINDAIFLIDLKPADFENFIASYVLKGEKTAIIETGPTLTVPNLLKGLEEINVKPDEIDFVMVSHIHLDHGGGAGTLLEHLPNAKLIVHPRGIPHLEDPQTLWVQARKALGKIVDFYGKPQPIPKDRMIPAENNMQLDLGDDIRIRIIETLGHASHHISFFEKSNEILFPGDTAGIYIRSLDVIVPTTPPLLVLHMILDSIEKLKKLEPKKLCYTHFGLADDALGKLDTYANQLKLWASIIKQGLKNGENLERIRERIIEEDSTVRKALPYIKNHPIMSRGIILQNIEGFIAYFKKFQK